MAIHPGLNSRYTVDQKKGEKTMAKLIINEENKKSRIEPEIYGHFSEHLGRCIYEGIYVGEKSEITDILY